ncbi:adenylate/guanylate cyclase domain-containing protein [Streptomyces cellulosae]|uniref:Adenylate/guanylate cyclase domain-containing protein n=1 Tax=Streptomyces cellulosae TaxID=1968 RepID=A0ABW7YAH4_STRCE
MTCDSCRAALPRGARFCPGCGARVAPADLPVRESRRMVTVLFCDMTDSTALSGSLDPEPLRELMVRYYSLMRSCLERHGGTVEKYIGDAVVAVFGVPVLHEDDALRALRAATEMRQALESLNVELRARIGVEIGIRIGVNTGEVVAAEDAHSGQVLTAGEAVNVAARLQQHAGPGEIILGPLTHTLTASGAGTDPVGELTLKGKAEPVPAWRLVELWQAETTLLRTRDVPFFGREAELGHLAGALSEAVHTASCRLVTVHGDSGVGKTRLAAEFAAKAARDGALAGVGRCPPYGEGRTLHALAEALRQIVTTAREQGDLEQGASRHRPGEQSTAKHGDRGNRAPEVRGSEVRGPEVRAPEVRAPKARAPEVRGPEVRAPEIRAPEVRAPEYGPGDSAAADDVRDALACLESGLLHDGAPGELPDQLTWAAALVLEAIGRRRPVLLVLDDLQWAKPVLLGILEQLAARISGAAVVVLGLARPELLETDASWGRGRAGAATLPLRPLAAPEARLLVAAVSAATAPHPAELVDRIVERAEGNPFYLEQLAAMADQGGTDALPPTVQSVIAARMDLLHPAEREVLQRAAVPGRRFSVPELATLLREEPGLGHPPDQELGLLTRRRLIVPEAAASYRFSGVLVRDVAYRTLAKRARLRYHELLAAWHRRHTDSPDQVGLHLEQAYRLAVELGPADHGPVARLRAEAAGSLAVAGTLALRRSDLQWAAELLARAQELYEPDTPGRPGVAVALAEARLLLGTDPQALQTLRTLAGEASAAGDERSACHARLLVAALELPGPAAAEEALAAVPVFEAAQDHLGLTRVWLRVGQLRQLAGRYQQAEELLGRALRHALHTDTQFELATVIGALATSLWRGPTPVETALEDCRALLAEHAAGRRAARATVSCPQAVLLAYSGAYDEARALVRGSIRIIEELGHAFGTAPSMIFAAMVEGLAGQWPASEALLREAAATAERHGDALSSSAAAAALARSLMEQGKDGEALASTETSAGTGDPFVEAEIHGVRARALALRGERSCALRESGRAVRIAAGTDSTVCRAMAQLDRAHVLHALGDRAAAATAAGAAQRLFTAKGHLVGVRWAASLAVTSTSRPLDAS